MALGEDEQVVEVVGSHWFHPTLRNRIRPRRSERRPHLLNAKAPQTALEGRAIAAVPIVNQKSRRPSIPSATFDDLLRGPLRRRTLRHRHVQNFSVEVPDHKKHIQRLEPDGSNAEEVACPYIRFMPFQELSPSWRRPSIAARAHVLGDGSGRKLRARGSLCRAIAAHGADAVDASRRIARLGRWSGKI
jgi:hypothetical protein